MLHLLLWLNRCRLLTSVICVGSLTFSLFFYPAQAQNNSSPVDLLQPEIRQTQLRQLIRLGLQGEHEQLRRFLLPLRAAAEQQGDKATLATMWMTETLSLALQNKPLEALAAYRQLPPLAEFESDRRALAYVLSLRAFLGYYRNDFKQVRADAERALRLLAPTTEPIETAFTLNALSLAQLAERRLDEAAQTLRQSLTLCEQAGEPILAAVTYNNLGLLSQYRDDHETALTQFNQSLARCRQYNVRSVQHYVLKNMGDSALQLGQNQQALDYYQQSLAARQQQGNSRELATIWVNISDTHLQLLHYHEAIQALEKCRAIEGALGDPNAEAWRTLNIAEVYERKEDFRTALELLQKSLALAEARQDVKTQVHAALSFTRILMQQNNPALAREYMQKALALAAAANERSLLPHVWMLAGSFYQWCAEYREALATYDKLLQLDSSAIRNRDKTSAWFGKAAVHITLNQFDEAESALRTGQHLAELTQAAFWLFDSAFWWSQLEQARNQPARALPYAQRAAVLAEQLGRQDIRGMAYALMGSLQRRLGRPTEAYAALQQAITAHEWLREQTIGDVSQRAFSFVRALSPYHEMVRLLIGQRKYAEAFSFAERAKARALLDVLQHGQDQLTRSLTKEEVAEEQRRETTLRSLNLELTAVRAQTHPNATRLAALEKQQQQARLAREDCQTRLYAAHPNLKMQRGELRVFDTQEAAALGQGEPTALLEYVVTDEQILLFVLTPESKQLNVYEIPLRRAALAARVTQWRKQLAERDPAFRAPARQLADLLLGPARAQLRGKSRLVIVPDDALWELPFQALLLNERFLLEQHAISYAPSLTALREMMRARDQRAKTGSASLLALGNPALPSATLARTAMVYRDFSLAPLPEAEREVNTLARLYGAANSQVFTGTAAREALVKAEASKHNILHFATHGILNDASPLYSHLLLTQSGSTTGQDEDGLLEAREVLKLDLRAELVTLSACETARGQLGTGEGVIGLSWAFFVAGSPATLVSQWKVESSSTTNLMLGFYQILRTANPPSKATALRQAALRIMQSPAYRHPFYWAGFVLIGDAR